MLIIFQKLNSINKCNFRFTNTEAVRTIASMMISSMEIQLFQLSQVFKYLECKPIIHAWFRRFKISINLNILLLCYFGWFINLLMKFSFYKF